MKGTQWVEEGNLLDGVDLKDRMFPLPRYENTRPTEQ